MNCKLFKVRVNYKDSKTKKDRYFFNYFICLENGAIIQVDTHVRKSDDGKYYSSESALNLIATEVIDITEIRY